MYKKTNGAGVSKTLTRARYFVWNFKGYLWNSTQNISPIHWKMRFLYSFENLRALIFTSSNVFFYCHIYPRLWHGLLITWLNAIEVIVWSSNYIVISLIRFYFAKHLLFHAIVVNFVQKVLPSKVFRVGSVTGVFSMISYWHVQMDYVNVIVQNIGEKTHCINPCIYEHRVEIGKMQL